MQTNWKNWQLKALEGPWNAIYIESNKHRDMQITYLNTSVQIYPSRAVLIESES